MRSCAHGEEDPDAALATGAIRQPNGRPVGTRNRLNDQFIKALHDDFCEHGVRAIAEVRETQPAIYLKLICSILPRELHLKNDISIEHMSDAEIDAELAAMDEAERVAAAAATLMQDNGKPH